LAPRAVTESGNCEPRLAHQVHILDFEITVWPAATLEQEVDPRVLAVLHFPTEARIARQFRQGTGRQRGARKQVRMRCVDADEFWSGA
jgi:hypothetical protein